MQTLPSLQIGQHIARYPIIQGGMGIRISGANLASAVANAGGIGVISAVGLGINSPYFDITQPNARLRREEFFAANRLALIDELNKARELSPDGIIGVNVMVAAKDYETLVRTAAEQGVNLIISGAGLPLQLPEYTAEYPEVAMCRSFPLLVRRKLSVANGNASTNDYQMPLWWKIPIPQVDI